MVKTPSLKPGKTQTPSLPFETLVRRHQGLFESGGSEERLWVGSEEKVTFQKWAKFSWFGPYHPWDWCIHIQLVDFYGWFSQVGEISSSDIEWFFCKFFGKKWGFSALPKTNSMFAPKNHGDIQGQEGICSRAFWLVLGRAGPFKKNLISQLTKYSVCKFQQMLFLFLWTYLW